jgi:hypothetical protein
VTLSSEQTFYVLILGIIGLLAVLFWLIYWVYRARLLAREERRLMIEKGIPPPSPQPVGWPAVKAREMELQYEERRLFIEKGLTPEAIHGSVKVGSPEMITDLVDALRPKKNPRQPQDYLRKGLRALAFGMGLGGAYILFNRSGIDHSDEAQNWFLFFGMLGQAVILYGIANVVIYLTTKNRPGAG